MARKVDTVDDDELQAEQFAQSVTPPPTYAKGWEPRVTQGKYEAEAVTSYVDSDDLDEEDLIRLWRLNPAKWEIVDGSLLVNRYNGMTGKKRNNELVWLYQYKARLKKRLTDEDLPLGLRIPPTLPVKVAARGRMPRQADLPDGWMVGTFWPDSQFGYVWGLDGTLHTIHDERCFDLRNQILVDLRSLYGRIDLLVSAGDTIDSAHFSRFLSLPGYVERTLQPAIDRTCLEWQQVRAIEPDGDFKVIDGNHDTPRLITSLISKGLGALVGLRQGATDIAADPIMSVQHLTRTADFNVEFVEAYPTGVVRFNDSLVASHSGGAYSNRKGGTAAKILEQTRSSVIHGHTHREESAALTVQTEDGPRTYYVQSPGTFCRTDLAVPSVKSKGTSRGVPAIGQSTEDWQQGFYIIMFDPSEESHFSIEHIRIWNGSAEEPSTAYWRGRRYVSTVDADGNTL